MKKNCPVCTQLMTDLLDSAICQQDGHHSWIESEFSWSVRMLLNDDNDSQVDISAYDLAGVSKATVLIVSNNKGLFEKIVVPDVRFEDSVKLVFKFCKLKAFI
jgi:hypothetical protein